MNLRVPQNYDNVQKCVPGIFLGVEEWPTLKSDYFTDIFEANVQKLWDPRHLTVLQPSTACYRDSLNISLFILEQLGNNYVLNKDVFSLRFIIRDYIKSRDVKEVAWHNLISDPGFCWSEETTKEAHSEYPACRSYPEYESQEVLLQGMTLNLCCEAIFVVLHTDFTAFPSSACRPVSLLILL